MSRVGQPSPVRDPLHHKPSASAQAGLYQDVLDSLPATIALLDRDGVIVMVNLAWRRFAIAGALEDPGHGIGRNYLTICDRVVGADSLPASRAAAGIRSVLRGESGQFSMEYVIESPRGETWFSLTASPAGPVQSPGATVMHLDVTARKHDESALWRFATAMDSLHDGVFIIDRSSMTLTYVNDAACHLHGVSRARLLAMKPWEIMSVSREELERKYDRVITQGGAAEAEETLWRRADGTPFWIEIRRHAHCLEGAMSMVVLVRDITPRKLAESRIRYLNRVYAILSGINTLIVRVGNREELFQSACRIAVEQGGFRTCWIGIVDRRTDRLSVAASAGMSGEYREQLARLLQHGSPAVLEPSYVLSVVRDKRIGVCNDSARDSRVLAGDHHAVHGIRSFAILPLIVADEAIGVLGLYAEEMDFFQGDELRLLSELAADVSFAIDHIEKQERLDFLAYYDVLTGLPNRRLFLDRLTQLVRGAELAGRKLAVCITDLRRFRNINDSMGRAAGDSLLRQVADWLVSHLGDGIVVGRLDSDHFAVALLELENEDDAARIVENLIRSFAAQAFRLEDIEHRMAINVGVALFPDDGADADLLFKNAGAALTKAKTGHDPYLFYARRMTETVAGRMGLENQLRQALERQEFVVHYQPKMNLATGDMVGAEALLRWNDPRTGLVPPARFIPVLEETGLILEVGRWVLDQAIGEHLKWRRAGHRGLRVAVNVSPRQLRHPGFVEDIRRAVAIDECVAGGLELEITESLIMEDVKLSIAALDLIRKIGISIAIDDFGTGYSSLSHLAKLPIDTLKVDRSFILDMTAGPSGLSLVSTIINLAHSLELKVVAEGVETAEQALILKRLSCDEVQGFLYGKPLPAEAFEEAHLIRSPAGGGARAGAIRRSDAGQI